MRNKQEFGSACTWLTEKVWHFSSPDITYPNTDTDFDSGQCNSVYTTLGVCIGRCVPTCAVGTYEIPVLMSTAEAFSVTRSKQLNTDGRVWSQEFRNMENRRPRSAEAVLEALLRQFMLVGPLICHPYLARTGPWYRGFGKQQHKDYPSCHCWFSYTGKIMSN